LPSPGRTTHPRPPAFFLDPSGAGQRLAGQRPLLRLAQAGRAEALREALSAEERGEREQDRAYWRPLKAELEHLRHAMRSDSKTTGEAQ